MGLIREDTLFRVSRKSMKMDYWPYWAFICSLYLLSYDNVILKLTILGNLVNTVQTNL